MKNSIFEMNLINRTFKVLTLLIASGVFANSTIEGGVGGGGSGTKPAKVAKYKTPQMVYFVNSTIEYLNSNGDNNGRDLRALIRCQKTFKSGKSIASGIEVRSLETCKSLMKNSEYNILKTAINQPLDEIRPSLDEKKPPLDQIQTSLDQIDNKNEKRIMLEKDTQNKTNSIIDKVNSSEKNNSDLIFF